MGRKASTAIETVSAPSTRGKATAKKGEAQSTTKAKATPKAKAKAK